MKNLAIIIFTTVFILSIFIGVETYLYLDNKNNIDEENTKLVATFHGGSSEKTYETEIYKIDNDQKNYGFNYINYECTTKRYGSKEIDKKILNKGTIMWTDEAFIVAKKNNAYSYVTVPNSDKAYSIEDFEKMFLMD